MTIKKLNNSSGYTLIELLTVVTIIGILASIAIPNYRGYRDKAKMVTVYAGLHQIMLAQEVYWTDYERFFPDSNPPHSDSNPLVGDGTTISVNGLDIDVMVPHGQTYTISSDGDKDQAVKNYTVTINMGIDRNQDGAIDINDIITYSRTVGGASAGVVTNVPTLQ